MDGGYTLRKWKKILLREIRRHKTRAADRKARWEAKKAAERGETPSEAEEQTIPEESQGPNIDEDTDVSDVEDDWVNMDDESFQKIVEEVRSMTQFKNEEEAKAFFDEKIKAEWRKMKRGKKPIEPIDIREDRDPYYRMVKRDMPIRSRYVNAFDVDDKSYHKLMDRAEAQIGRYPLEFRHYENYESYKIVNPSATIAEYHEDSKDIKIITLSSESSS